jgi:hypothetical protein
MLIELFVWGFMTFSAIYYGKIFDYKYFETSRFVAHVNGGENVYYNLMFGYNLNFTTNIEHQKNVQGKVCKFNAI